MRDQRSFQFREEYKPPIQIKNYLDSADAKKYE